ncbi:CD83 antigen [Kryptolebias marmoratus]|uniref:CD83 molecule n=1 Tax=Kryptolebias marmoratus TaxID=37003 RepID=A0A3Q3AYB5_KRYMA|nr:CD83 antigen [Kryptolebias marmoratus]
MIVSPNLPSFVLLFSLSLRAALGRAVGEDAPEVSSVSGRDCSLQCTATQKPGVQYMAVRWYKLRTFPSPLQSGLITRNLPNDTTRWYTGVDMKVNFQGESLDIFLPNVTCSDSGVYLCYLAAPVGEQNREGKVVLTLTDCPVEPTPVPAAPTKSPVRPAESLLTDSTLVIFASAVLMVALVIFVISYSCLKNTLGEKGKMTKREIPLNAPLKPLEKKDLMLIYTLGAKMSTMKHICV